MRLRPGLCPRPYWGSLQRYAGPLAAKREETQGEVKAKAKGGEGEGREERGGKWDRGRKGRGDGGEVTSSCQNPGPVAELTTFQMKERHAGFSATVESLV